MQYLDKTTYNTEDLKIATKAVTDKLEIQFSLANDPMLTDLVNQAINESPQGKAEYQPLTFLPDRQLNIPERILIAMNKS